MPIQVSEALDLDTGEVVTVRRYAAGGYVDGIYVDGANSTFKSLISAQQPTQQDLQRLPEGQRVKDVRKFISKKRLKTANEVDGTIADIILYDGLEFEVIAILNWDAFGHTDALAARKP